MSNTKEKILVTALRLFAQDGYEAVSVSKIAGELGMTKGALYKHYKNKRDIFNKIFDHICQLDAERAQKAGVPEKEFDGVVEPFRHTSIISVKAYMESQFDYWSKDEIACNFRKMLTLEQYRNSEMTQLYQKVFGSGPVQFIEDLFREMMEQKTLCIGDPKQLAVEFYAPFYLLLSISDTVHGKDEKVKIKNLHAMHLNCFFEKYAGEMLSYEV